MTRPITIPGDTWTSGKILPAQESDPEKRLVCDDFLTLRDDLTSVTVETFWYTYGRWESTSGDEIKVRAWRRIPMDGIDEAVRQGDLA